MPYLGLGDGHCPGGFLRRLFLFGTPRNLDGLCRCLGICGFLGLPGGLGLRARGGRLLPVRVDAAPPRAEGLVVLLVALLPRAALLLRRGLLPRDLLLHRPLLLVLLPLQQQPSVPSVCKRFQRDKSCTSGRGFTYCSALFCRAKLSAAFACSFPSPSPSASACNLSS